MADKTPAETYAEHNTSKDKPEPHADPKDQCQCKVCADYRASQK